MAYKMGALARDAFADMDKYIRYMRMHNRRAKRVFITKKQHEIICIHLTRVKREQLTRAPEIKEFKHYKGCEVVIYGGG